MARALVVYESMYGNTRDVAMAVGKGLEGRFEVVVVEVAGAPEQLGGIDLLVVGGPTHARGMSNPQTRESAAANVPELVSRGSGIREWLDRVRPKGIRVATFDTRIQGPRWLWGSAARAAAKRLRKRGCEVVIEPESFLVHGPFGAIVDVLLDGERERARVWGDEVGRAWARELVA